MNCLRLILFIAIQIPTLALIPPRAGAVDCLPGYKPASSENCIPQNHHDCGDGKACPSGYKCGANHKCIGPRQHGQACGRRICTPGATCWRGDCRDLDVFSICGEILCSKGKFYPPGSRCAACLPGNARERPECSALAQQFERDKQEARRLHAAIEMGRDELNKWNKARKEAELGALKAGVNAIWGRFAEGLAHSAKAAQGYKGTIARLEAQMKGSNVSFAALQSKLDAAYQGYMSAMATAKAGTVLKRGGEIKDLWELVRSEAQALNEVKEQSDRLLHDVLEDESLKTSLTNAPEAREFLANLAEAAAATKDLAKFASAPVTIAAFVSDFGYSATEWLASRERILSQYNLTEQELKAAAAIRKQLRCTVSKLRHCRAGEAVQPCPAD